MVDLKRVLVVAWRKNFPSTFPFGVAKKPVCPNKYCEYYMSDKWIQRIQEDEYGQPVHNQWVCDYFAEGKPPGCGQIIVWLKEDTKKLSDNRQRSFPVAHRR